MSFRDVREHQKLDWQHKLEAFDWNLINNSYANINKATNFLSDSSKRMYDETYQLIKIKGSSRDPPYMMRLKHLCKKRNKHIKEGDEHDLQEHIDNLI